MSLTNILKEPNYNDLCDFFQVGSSTFNFHNHKNIKKAGKCQSSYITFSRRFDPKRLTVSAIIHLFSLYVFSGNRTHDLLHC